ncbi:MAG: Slp family lipoprotein, partial [Thiohalomonadales bacterium]
MNKLKILALSIITVALTSCAIKPPVMLQLPESEKTVALENPELHSSLGKTVRWGGTIIDVKNNKDNTQITVLGYPLDDEARPVTFGKKDSRRFIANFNRFIEPNSYTKKREITIVGKLNRIEESKVGEFNYELPVVSVEEHVLWPDRNSLDPYYYGGYGYGGYYGYGYGYSSYFYPYYGGHGGHHYYSH